MRQTAPGNADRSRDKLMHRSTFLCIRVHLSLKETLDCLLFYFFKKIFTIALFSLLLYDLSAGRRVRQGVRAPHWPVHPARHRPRPVQSGQVLAAVSGVQRHVGRRVSANLLANGTCPLCKLCTERPSVNSAAPTWQLLVPIRQVARHQHALIMPKCAQVKACPVGTVLLRNISALRSCRERAHQKSERVPYWKDKAGQSRGTRRKLGCRVNFRKTAPEAAARGPRGEKSFCFCFFIYFLFIYFPVLIRW